MRKGLRSKNMLGKGIKEETYKNQTAEEDEYLAESLAAEFDRISFSEEKKERIYRRVKGAVESIKI